MFEGVREVIKSQVLWGVTQSEQQMDDEFTKKVLKVLFLVKYVKEFQSTPRNLTVLLIERFDQDLVALRKQVDQALSTLEQQTYIKRNEDIYEYLTDKERDIEEDIKQTDVDPQAINEQISNVFFTSALGMSKIKYERNGQDFPFTKRLDNQSFGKEYELGIHIITESQAKESLRAMSLQRDDLVVLIPDDERFYKDNRLYLQTETYVRQNSANGRTPEEIAIVTDKSHQNQARYEQIKRQAAELLGNAQMFVAGDDVPTQVSDRKVRISNGFQKLIEKVYPNLEMLGEARYDEKDIPKHLKAGKDALGDLLIQMSAPESEILSFIARNKVDGIRTTFSSLLNTFEKKPNGWSYASILCMVARLYGLAKIEVSLDNKLLDESSFERAIRNGTYHSRIIVQPVLEISATKIKRMKTVYADAFHKPVSTNEAKSLATEFSKAVEQKYFELQRYMERIDRFPFLEQLKPAVDLLRRLQNKTYDWYYSNLDEFEVELPDTIDHVVDPILSFMNGSQKAIYEDARKFLIDQQYNLPYVGGEEIERLKDILADKNCFRGNHMITAKELVGILSDKVERKLTELRQEKEQQLESYKRKLENIEGYAQLSQDRIDSVERELTSIQKQIQSITQISMINDRFSRFERSEYPQLASNIKDWAAVKEEPPRYIPEHPEDPPKVREEPPKKKMPITISNLRPRYRKTFLESQTDVEEYVQAFKAALLAELEKGNSLLVN
jgi:hypothetical protein